MNTAILLCIVCLPYHIIFPHVYFIASSSHFLTVKFCKGKNIYHLNDVSVHLGRGKLCERIILRLCLAVRSGVMNICKPAFHCPGWRTNVPILQSFSRGPVTFIFDPPKIGSPRNEFFLNIWTHSEKFVPTVDQPHQGKSVLVNDHEVTTKDISSVHSGIFRKLSDRFSSVRLGWPYAALTKIIAQFTRNRMQRTLWSLYIVCCWTYRPE